MRVCSLLFVVDVAVVAAAVVCCACAHVCLFFLLCVCVAPVCSFLFAFVR